MSQYATLMAVIPVTLLPLVAFMLIALFTRSKPELSSRLSIGAVAICFGLSVILLLLHRNMAEPVEFTVRWVVSGAVSIPFGFLLDPLSLLMLAIVAGISLLVQVYSLGYMADDPGFSRYYAFMSLFAWAMMNLTVAHTIIQLYIFWELVGLASYLLIGFWYEKWSASQAGKKAFVMTRTGDVAFFLGILVVLLHMGSFSITELNGPMAAEKMSPAVLTISALLIFGGIVGKSAQFPLLTWLPDAMEGPTPVSALLHSATMVAAGVYLFARLFPFFSQSAFAVNVFLTIGTASMLLASTMAMVSRDIKRVWAYSTISQLGFMIMALAAGGYFAGVFHLTTHAAFKALLFLCSGVLIHEYRTNDIYELGAMGSRRHLVPAACIIIAAAALAGIPPLSGYYSKEAIMGRLAGSSNPFWVLWALVGVFLTAYYSFRVIFVVFLSPTGAAVPPQAPATAHSRDAGGPGAASSSGPAGQPGHAGHDGGHAGRHDARHRKLYGFMTQPLIVLAAVTVLFGLLEGPLREFLLGKAASLEPHGGSTAAFAHIMALTLALAGVLTAWVEFGRKGASRIGFVERIPTLYNLFAERWYLDHFYRAFVDRVIDSGLSRMSYENDNKVIDGAVDGMGRGAVEGGRLMAVLNGGMIQYRLLATFVVVVLLSLYFFF